MISRIAAFLPLLAALATAPAGAHERAASVLHLDRDPEPLQVQWDVPLVELAIDLPIDTDADGRLTWGELTAAAPLLERAVLARAVFEAGGRPCRPLPTGPLELARHGDVVHARIHASLDCAGRSPVRVDHRAGFGADPGARVLVTESRSGRERVQLLTAAAPVFEPAASASEVAGRFFAQGIVHLVTGYDHLAFLLVLLVAAVRPRAGIEASLPATLRRAAWLVTAFTVAHSLTLVLATLGWLRLPAGPVEAAIAATVLLAALGSLTPLAVHGAGVAFAFGLVHGLGFANALSEIVAGGTSLLALAAFNLGLEVAQLVAAAIALPVIWWLAGRGIAGRTVLAGSSAAVAVLAIGWLWLRA
jgi:HupE / UreJ protein